MTMKRLKIFEKIIQAQDATTTPPTTTTDIAAAPKPTTVPGSPTAVTVDMFPTFVQAWGANFKQSVNNLIDTLNWAIFSMTVGQQDFFKLKSNSFQGDSTKFDGFTNSIIGFSKQVFNLMLNEGKPIAAPMKNKKEIISKLLASINQNSAIHETLTNVFPQNFLQSKIGNFKPKVISILTQMNALAGTE